MDSTFYSQTLLPISNFMLKMLNTQLYLFL